MSDDVFCQTASERQLLITCCLQLSSADVTVRFSSHNNMQSLKLASRSYRCELWRQDAAASCCQKTLGVAVEFNDISQFSVV
jgi:hypothetical protein